MLLLLSRRERCLLSDHIGRPKRRSAFLSIFGLFSLLGLFAVWGISYFHPRSYELEPPETRIVGNPFWAPTLVQLAKARITIAWIRLPVFFHSSCNVR